MLASNRRLEEWDEELEMTQAKLAQTLRAQEKAKIKLGEARSRYERAKAMLSLAGKKTAEIRQQERAAGSRSDEAQRRGEEARRRGQSQHRWIAESQQWDREGQRLAEDQLRWQEDSRRKDRELRAMNEEVKGSIAEVAGLTKTALAWEQKLRFLSQRGVRRSTAPRPESDGGTRPLSVTGRATSALKDMLDGMAREPGQALRLAVDSAGGMTLVLDTERAGDNVVSHGGEPVLFIDSPVPEDLQGSTLDISEKPEGSTIVLSH